MTTYRFGAFQTHSRWRIAWPPTTRKLGVAEVSEAGATSERPIRAACLERSPEAISCPLRPAAHSNRVSRWSK
jgi:hypothetical protein